MPANTPIPAEVTESTVAGWGFTKNTGTYSKPSGGIPKTDLAADVQTSLGKADTALQDFEESDPTVPSWAKQSTKPSYTAQEVGALPVDTPLFSGDYNDLDNKPNLATVATSGSYNDLSNKPTIPDVTNYVQKSQTAGLLKNDGSVDTNTYLTQHQDISGKQDKIDSSHKLSADLVEDGTTNKSYTATEKSKLAGIADGAEVNVQANWNESNSSSGAYIQNKPTIPDAVSGTNDGTNWTSLTIGSTTKAIPSGGGSLPSNVAYLSNDSGEGVVPAGDIIAGIINVSEEGFYIIDENHNIGGYENAQGGNIINSGGSSSGISYSVI